ncbi:MAG: hypothetical protein R6U88_04475 [Candidatus Bipolaricaulota bacterium]
MRATAVIPIVLGLLTIALGTAVGVLLSNMETRLASSEGRLAELDEEIEGWEERFAGVGEAAQSMAELEEIQLGILARITDLENAFDAADGRLEGLARDVRSLGEEVGEVQRELLVVVGEDPEALPERLVELEVQVASLDEQVEGLFQRIGELESWQERVTPPAFQPTPQ